MKFTAFVTSLFLVGSEAFAPSAGNAHSSTGKFKSNESHDTKFISLS